MCVCESVFVCVCLCVRACVLSFSIFVDYIPSGRTYQNTHKHIDERTHTHQHTNAVTHKNAYITHKRSWIDDTDAYTPWNIQEIVEQYVELGAVTVAGACNLWTAGLSEVGTRVLRDNRTALISAQFRVPRRIRGAWRRTLFSKTSHCQMCFRIKF